MLRWGGDAQKKLRVCEAFWVGGGTRTHDIQNHNLTL